MDDRKENAQTRKRSRTLEIRISKEIKVHSTRGGYCKVYKIPPNEMA